MNGILRKTFPAEVKEIDAENLIVEHFISTETVDRDGDIVRAGGMKVVGIPVVLVQHGRGPMGSEPVAKPLSIKKGNANGTKGLIARTQFFPDDTGRRLFAKTTGGYMPNWSIGFRILRADKLPGQDENPFGGRDIKEWELLEYSIVAVPAQPDAITPPGRKEEGVEEIAFKVYAKEDPPACEKCGAAMEVKEEDGCGMAWCEACAKPEEEVLYREAEKGENSPPDPYEQVARVTSTLAEMEVLLRNTAEVVAKISDDMQVLIGLNAKRLDPTPGTVSPAATEEGEGESEGNPPEEEERTPKPLRIEDDEAGRRAVTAMVRDALSEEVRTRARRMLGRVD